MYNIMGCLFSSNAKVNRNASVSDQESTGTVDQDPSALQTRAEDALELIKALEVGKCNKLIYFAITNYYIGEKTEK